MRRPPRPSLVANHRRFWRVAGMGLGLMAMLPPLAAADDTNPATTAKSAPSEPEMHTFTDAQGRTIQAQVLSLGGKTVHLKRDDGGVFDAPLDTFSEADQAYIFDVAIKQQIARNPALLSFSAQTQNVQTSTTSILGGTQVNWRENYTVTLKNLTLLTLTGLQVKVIIFKVLRLPDAPGASNTPVVLFTETHALDPMPPDSGTTFQTTPIDMEQILATSGGSFPNAPAAHQETDKLATIWIRVYHGENTLVQEWCSDPQVMKLQSWDATWAMANPPVSTRGARPGAATGRAAPARGPRRG